jgi:hypothetical protein
MTKWAMALQANVRSMVFAPIGNVLFAVSEGKSSNKEDIHKEKSHFFPLNHPKVTVQWPLRKDFFRL